MGAGWAAAAAMSSGKRAGKVPGLLLEVMHPGWLYFADQRQEQSFATWHAAQRAKVDLLAALLMLVLFLALGCTQPFVLFQTNCYAHTIAVMACALPPFLMAINLNIYIANRDMLLSYLTVGLLAYWSFVAVPAALSVATPRQLLNPLWAAKLTLVEPMILLPLCFTVRFYQLVPLQVATWLGLGLRLLPSLSAALADVLPSSIPPLAASAVIVAAQVLLGILLPAASVHRMETKARFAFIQQSLHPTDNRQPSALRT